MRRAVALLALMAGCGEPGAGPADLGVPDLRAGAAIGATCASDGECGEGAQPVCFQETLFNQPGVLKTTSGYCSARCAADGDCGAAGRCVDLGMFGRWCFAGCAQPSDCRDGYACFYSPGPHCFPNGNLRCDPNAGDGSCATKDGTAGGCIRYAIGSGLTGLCVRGCNVGPGTCPAMQQCVLWHAAGSYGGTAENRFTGPICVLQTTPVATGDACDSLSGCVDGDECFTSKLLVAGDDLCHPLCEPLGDGGLACATATCKDVFGLFDAGAPIGLCL
jgi:hypothetical protein